MRSKENYKNFINLILFSTILLCSGQVLAYTIEQGSSGEMIIDGTPLNPACFYSQTDDTHFQSTNISIENCNQNIKEVKGANHVQRNGSYGIEWPTQHNQAYIFYKYIGLYRGNPLLSFSYASGGTGHFTSLELLEIKNGELSTIKIFGVGDRCMNSVKNVRIDGDDLFIERNFTTFELFTYLEQDLKVQIDKNTKGKTAVGIGCIGTGLFKNEELIQINLDRDRINKLN